MKARNKKKKTKTHTKNDGRQASNDKNRKLEYFITLATVNVRAQSKGLNQ